MKRIWTIIGVRDVAASYKWYRSLFGQTGTGPAHHHWGQICDSDGTVLLCLHQWGSHDHPSLMSSDTAPAGNGLLMFFRVDDFDRALARARGLVERLDEEPHVNPATGTREFALRDPDGYHSALIERQSALLVEGIASGQRHREQCIGMALTRGWPQLVDLSGSRNCTKDMTLPSRSRT